MGCRDCYLGGIVDKDKKFKLMIMRDLKHYLNLMALAFKDDPLVSLLQLENKLYYIIQEIESYTQDEIRSSEKT